MVFQRIQPVYIQGTAMYGRCLDGLHSASIDWAEIREWVRILSRVRMPELEEGDDGIPFKALFYNELMDYCIFIAHSDGSISANEIDAINYLLDTKYLDPVNACSRGGYSMSWGERFPPSFQFLVLDAAGYEQDVNAAGEIALFYRRVAQHIYSVDHADEFEKNCAAFRYVDAFKKFVERVSVTRFALPDMRETVDDVCDDWERLSKGEADETLKMMCGAWQGVQGNALFKHGLGSFVLNNDGRGTMVRKRFLWSEEVDVTWEIVDYLGGPMPVIHIPQLNADVYMVVPDSDRMIATVYSSDPALHLKMATYVRER